MTILERTICSFPRGRTTEELFALLDVDFQPSARAALLSELNELQEQGRVRRSHDGRWSSIKNLSDAPAPDETPKNKSLNGLAEQILLQAVPAQSRSTEIEATQDEAALEASYDSTALLRYYRSALIADPRGAITQQIDRHGTSWQLLSAFDFQTPDDLEEIEISVNLEHLPGDLRQKLSRDLAEDNALALGWPIAVISRQGVPSAVPVGLVAATWSRSQSHLILRLSADDVLVNPDWVKYTSRSVGWRAADLQQLMHGADGGGLKLSEFVLRLKEAAASQIRDGLQLRPVATLNTEIEGIHSAAALFFPTEDTITSGASRDLDKIAAWPEEVRNQTALGALFGSSTNEASVPALSVGPLNSEQIEAVRLACTAPLTVVTGPPGTGKSQAITAISASILASGGSVLVASKNHQALDAVEDRLGAIAPGVSFLVRTLDSSKETNQSFRSALDAIVKDVGQAPASTFDADFEQLHKIVVARDQSLDARRRHDELRSDLADIVERIYLREDAQIVTKEAGANPRQTIWQRLLAWFQLRTRAAEFSVLPSDTTGLSTRSLAKRANQIKRDLAELDLTKDPVELSGSVTKHSAALLPKLIASRCTPSDADRRALTEAHADSELVGPRHQMSRDIADCILRFRPLWLASILGAPKRIPLEPGLFDLVIFDEASQCDIASALPLFARAKRAVVVGDDRQLSPMKELGIAQDRNLMAVQGLGPNGMGRFAQSRRTLFDLANSMPDASRVMLRDQYRSASDIVDYISGHFYGGNLRAAGPPDRFRTPKGMKQGIAWTDVVAPSQPQRGNVNPPEVNAIVEHLKSLLVKQAYRGSIGVITPFRPQVANLSKAIRASIDASLLDEVDFKTGTVDSFQGQERDVIIFSPCIGPTAAASAVQFIQKDWRRLNVAISRARAVAHVFGDLGFAKSGKVKSLQKLAAYATQPKAVSRDGDFDSEWERRVFHALENRGLKPVPQYELAGRRLDFALFSGDIKLDLEVDGRYWHTDTDGNRKQSDLWRDDMLRGLGWRVRRFWVDELADDMEKCIDIVERDLS